MKSCCHQEANSKPGHWEIKPALTTQVGGNEVIRVLVHMASFVTGIILGGILLAYVVIYGFQNMDPKFLEVPSMAFQMEMFGVVAQIIFGSFGFTLGLITRKCFLRKNTPGARHWYVSFIFGSLYVFSAYLLADIDLVPGGWIYLIGVPFLFAWILPRGTP